LSLAADPTIAALMAVAGRAANPIAVLDADGACVAANTAFRERYGEPGSLVAALGPVPAEWPDDLEIADLPGLPGFRLLTAPPGAGPAAQPAAQGTVTSDAVGAPVWEWDPVTRQGRWQPVHRELLGIEPDEPFAETWRSRVHPDDLEEVDAAEARCLAVGRSDVEYRYLHPTLGTRWIHTRSALISERGITAGISIDVTDRRNADERVRDSEAHLRRVLDTLSVFVGVALPDGTLAEANRAPLEAAGLTSADVIGKPFEDAFWWSYDPAVQAQLRAAIDRAAAGEASRYDVTIRAAGDTRLTIDFQIVPVFDEAGAVTHLVPSGVDVTQRVRIEEALRESEQRLQHALEAARAGTFDIDLASGQATVSPSTNRVFGLPDDAELGLSGYLDRVHPEDRGAVEAAVRRSIDEGVGHEIEYRVAMADGGVRWIASRAEPICDVAGRVTRLVGTLMDITERRKAETTLRESEERFRATFDLAAVGLAHVGLDGRWLRVNDRLCEILGYERTVLLTRTFQEITHPDDVGVDVAQASRLVAGEIPTYTMEKRYLRGDGSVVWAELTGSLVRHSDGTPHYFVAAVQDISDRKRSDETIRRQLAEIETIYQHAGVGLCVLDRDLRYVRVNERLAEMNGRPISSHIGRTIREVVPGLADQVETDLRRVLETGQPAFDLEVTGRTPANPDVERTWLENWIPIFGPSGQAIGISVTAEDITERRKVDELRDTFIGMLSHELRTPMTALYAASQLLLRRRQEDHGDTELVHELAAGAERLHRIVENLLVLARVERGLTLPGTDPVLLQRVLPGVLEAERRLWPDQRIDLVPLPPDLPPVRSDVDALGQVIRNLVSNAAKYGSPDGRVHVRVQRGRDHVSIRVLDEGPGFGDVDPTRLFEIYYRAEDAAMRAPGAGIGLFVCRALVEGMGGRITARNRARQGAEFCVSLPIFREDG
jgi:PAS domain S-box-containing protein